MASRHWASSAFHAFIRAPAWWGLAIAFWAVVLSLSYLSHHRDLDRHADLIAVLRGRLVFQMIETTRLWAARHGGVFVPITADTPPNPYLDVEEKVIETPSGRPLTLVNPAYMTRQLAEILKETRDFRVRLTSLRPINPGNEPDAWEKSALTGFEADRRERIDLLGRGTEAVFRYMAPLEVKPACMACHAKQGYQVGDVRGGISVSFPASSILEIIDAQKRAYLAIHGAAFALFGLLAVLGLLVIRRYVRELEMTRVSLVESEKMASLGRMVAGFAHEVNTPVGVAVGATSQGREALERILALLEQDEVTEEALRSQLDIIAETGDLALSSLRRAAELVRSFKRTAVDQSSELERDYDLAEVIADVLNSLRNTLKNTPIRVVAECPPDLALHGPAGAVEQVLINLLENSRLHAFDEGKAAGTIRILAASDGREVSIAFSDDGRGMTPEQARQAFEPFFTSRRNQGGSGLGLTIVYNLVTVALEGDISCQSTPGSGTTFRITFPARRRRNMDPTP